MQLRLVNMVVPGGEVMRQAKGLAAKIANKSAVGSGGGDDGDSRWAGRRPAEGLAAEREQFAMVDRQRRRARRHHGVPGEA